VPTGRRQEARTHFSGEEGGEEDARCEEAGEWVAVSLDRGGFSACGTQKKKGSDDEDEDEEFVNSKSSGKKKTTPAAKKVR
jgi:hypothetical protein